MLVSVHRFLSTMGQFPSDDAEPGNWHRQHNSGEVLPSRSPALGVLLYAVAFVGKTECRQKSFQGRVLPISSLHNGGNFAVFWK